MDTTPPSLWLIIETNRIRLPRHPSQVEIIRNTLLPCCLAYLLLRLHSPNANWLACMDRIPRRGLDRAEKAQHNKKSIKYQHISTSPPQIYKFKP
jgi:hypothetical protein